MWPFPRNRETVRCGPDGPNTVTAPPTPDTCGGCACTWSAPCIPCPLGWVLTGATADERHALHDMLANTNNKQILIGDNNYFGAEFESQLADGGIELLRRARTGEKPRPGSEFFTPLR